MKASVRARARIYARMYGSRGVECLRGCRWRLQRFTCSTTAGNPVETNGAGKRKGSLERVFPPCRLHRETLKYIFLASVVAGGGLRSCWSWYSTCVMLARIFPYINFGPGESRRRAARLHTSTLMTTRLRDVLENPSGDRAFSPVTAGSLFFVAATRVFREASRYRGCGECFLHPCLAQVTRSLRSPFRQGTAGKIACKHVEISLFTFYVGKFQISFNRISCKFTFQKLENRFT